MKKYIFILMIILSINIASAALIDGATHYYSFEGNAKDNISTSDITVTEALNVNAKIGKGYQCDGNNDFLSVPAFSLGSTWTFSAWVYQSSYDVGDVNKNDYWAYVDSGNNGIIGGQTQATNKPSVYIYGSSWVLLQASGTTAAGSYHNFVITHSNTDSTKYYIDSVLVDSKTASVVGSLVTQYLCRYDTHYFTGIVDEVGFWNRTLSDDSCSVGNTCGGEIATLYNSGNGLTYPFSSGGDTTPPKLEYKDQYPTPISFANNVVRGLNVTYNISDNVDINNSANSRYLNYSLNISGNALNGYLNGTAISGFQKSVNYINKSANNHTFTLYDNQIFYALYNYNESVMETTSHSRLDCGLSSCQYIGEFFNFSNTNPYNIFELDIRKDNLNPFPVVVGLCNARVADVTISPNCTQIFSNNNLPVNHSHINSISNHSTVTFTFDSTNGKVNGLWINSTIYPYVITNNNPAFRWNLGYITAKSRTNAYMYYNTTTSSYQDLSLSFDWHIHQNATLLNYQACAYDTSNNFNCSEMRKVSIGQDTNIDPDSPLFTNPNATMTNFVNPAGNITFLSWIIGLNPDGAAMSQCGITLHNYSTNAWLKDVNKSLGLNTSYNWYNSVNYTDVFLNLSCCDITGHCSNSFSTNFSLSYFSVPVNQEGNISFLLNEINNNIIAGNAQAHADWLIFNDKFDEVFSMIILYGIFAVCLVLGLKYVSQLLLICASSSLFIIGVMYVIKNNFIWNMTGVILIIISIALFINLWFFAKTKREYDQEFNK